MLINGCAKWRKSSLRGKVSLNAGSAVVGPAAQPEGRQHDRGRESQLKFWPPLPPNRTGGFPASGSPVGGLTSERIDGSPAGLRVRRTTPGRHRRHSANTENQAEPPASFDPLFRGPSTCGEFRPRLGAGPSGQSLASVSSHVRHCTEGLSVGLLTPHPPSYTPSLHGSYPASSLLWVF